MEVYIVTITDGDGWFLHIGAYSNAAKAKEAVDSKRHEMVEEGDIEEEAEFDLYYEVEFYKVEVDGE